MLLMWCGGDLLLRLLHLRLSEITLDKKFAVDNNSADIAVLILRGIAMPL